MMSNIGKLLAAAAFTAAAVLPPAAAAEDAKGVAADVPPAAAPVAPSVALAVDSDAAESLARREGCLKCHGATKDKEGPSFRKIAGKYKDKPDAEARILKHIRSGEMVKFSDGEEEEHRIIRSKDEGAVANLIRWILTR